MSGEIPQEVAADGTAALPWRDVFHLHAFVHLSSADGAIDLRARVWIKRFLLRPGQREIAPALAAQLEAGVADQGELERLTARAASELSAPEKNHFVYNMAQLCKARGAISTPEYECIVDLAQRIGVADTEADAIINTVYSINDTFMATVGLLAIGAILYFTRVVIIPLVIAIMITMLIDTVEGIVARRLGLRRLRWLSRATTMVLILVALFGLVMAAVASGRDVARRVPFYEATLNRAMERSPRATRAVEWLRRNGVAPQWRAAVGKAVTGFLASMVNMVGNFVLVVIFTGFLVFSTRSVTGVAQEMTEKIGAYISIKTMVNVLVGGVVFVLCLAFGIDFPLFWAIMAFLLNFIPSVGAIIATLPPIALAVLQTHSIGRVALFAGVLVTVQVLLGQVLEPKLMGRKLAVRPVAILLGLIFWGLLWGIPGMFLAAPLMALLRILSSYFNFSRSFERLLAAR